MLGLRNFIRRLRSVQAGDEQGVRRGADNIDAEAAATSREKTDFQGGEFPGSVPPNYIKSYDDGRPPH
ncbi:MAG TPA: hypothetical protein VF063_06845 [Gaiellaceae bacterium]